MPHDKRGTEVRVSDIVMAPCRVKAIHLTEDFCNVDIETQIAMPPLGTVSSFTLNSRQTIKPIASHTFAEYGHDQPDTWRPVNTAPLTSGHGLHVLLYVPRFALGSLIVEGWV